MSSHNLTLCSTASWLRLLAGLSTCGCGGRNDTATSTVFTRVIHAFSTIFKKLPV
jgi:hypothetical protein